jgi:hypothetical protein
LGLDRSAPSQPHFDIAKRQLLAALYLATQFLGFQKLTTRNKGTLSCAEPSPGT